MGESSTETRRRAAGAPLGPGSLLWSIAGDPRSLLPGTAAGLMQLMLPSLGAGVTDHSNFFDDPYDRIFRSIPFIWGSIFAEGDEADARGREIRDFHPDIEGTDDQGRRYHALDPDTFWWAHATFTWEFFRAQELYLPQRLGRQDRERLYAETVTWYRRYGVSDRPVPATYADFRARFEDVCAHELERTPAVRWVLDPSTNPGPSRRPRLPGPLSLADPLAHRFQDDVLRLLVWGCMPDVVRRRFEIPWSHVDRVRYASLCLTLQRAGPAVRRGALRTLWPKGTPHLDPADHARVVIAGESS